MVDVLVVRFTVRRLQMTHSDKPPACTNRNTHLELFKEDRHYNTIGSSNGVQDHGLVALRGHIVRCS